MTGQPPDPAPRPTPPPPHAGDVMREIHAHPLPEQVTLYEAIHRELVDRLKGSET